MIAPFSLISSSEEATRALGGALGRALAPGAVVLLDGDLGTGKTVLVRGVGAALGVSGVRSPSFTLVNEYRTKDGLMLAHVDLYRLDADGVEALGLEDYMDGAALLVEWPDRWPCPPKEALRVELRALDRERRALTFYPDGGLSGRVAEAALAAVRLGECPGVEIVQEDENGC